MQKQLQCRIDNMKLIHWLLMGEPLHLVLQAGDWEGPQPAQSSSRCTKCNKLTTHPPTASVPITVNQSINQSINQSRIFKVA